MTRPESFSLGHGRPNSWVQATPGCACLFILSRWAGVPDPELKESVPESSTAG